MDIKHNGTKSLQDYLYNSNFDYKKYSLVYTSQACIGLPAIGQYNLYWPVQFKVQTNNEAIPGRDFKI